MNSVSRSVSQKVHRSASCRTGCWSAEQFALEQSSQSLHRLESLPHQSCSPSVYHNVAQQSQLQGVLQRVVLWDFTCLAFLGSATRPWFCSACALLPLPLKPSQYCASLYLHHATLTHPSSYVCCYHFLLSWIVLILVHTASLPFMTPPLPGSGVHVRCDGSRPGQQWNYRPDPLGYNRWHAGRPAKRGTKPSYDFPRNFIFLSLFNSVLYS